MGVAARSSMAGPPQWSAHRPVASLVGCDESMAALKTLKPV
jgi:hypothetical protein